jgi:hypothetical protein
MIARPLALAAIAALALAAAAPSARAETIKLRADLAGTKEIPPTDSAGKGIATLEYDTVKKQLVYTVAYNGLKAPATAAHIHGPAGPQTNAGIVLPFASPASPIKGQVTLTDAQAADLLAGRYYVNIHSSSHPSGEIRGQITR